MGVVLKAWVCERMDGYIVVGEWCNDGRERLGGQRGMLKTLASGWTAGESFMIEMITRGSDTRDCSVVEVA